MTALAPPAATPGPLRLDKWYVDTLLADGTILLVYLGSLTAGPVTLSRVSADLFLPDGAHRSGGCKGRRPRLAAGAADFGAAGFEGGRLWFDTPGLSGDLAFNPRHPGFEPHTPFLVSGRRSLRWVMEVPDADVEGEVRWPGGSRAVAGRGYRDRVWTDIPLWRLPLHELRWGRAVAGDHACAWVQATGPAGVTAAAWQDGRLVDRDFTPPLAGSGRVILAGPVIDLETLHLGPLRGPLGRLLHTPHQVKQAAPASLVGVAGQAIHEVVTWPR